jgi:methionyl-tRNA formyltransferase
MKKRVVILGKGSLAIRAAEWILENSNFELSYIVPDIPEPTWTSSLSQWALANSIPIVTSGHFKDLPQDVEVDLAISIFYGRILKERFIERCGYVINLHNGPLPRYRGVRPINWALKNGENSHGVTIHKITKGIDDGPILGQVVYPIYPEIEEVEDVYLKALEYGWLLFADVMGKFDYSSAHATKQEGEATYYSMKENALLGDRGDFRRQK